MRPDNSDSSRRDDERMEGLAVHQLRSSLTWGYNYYFHYFVIDIIDRPIAKLSAIKANIGHKMNEISLLEKRVIVKHSNWVNTLNKNRPKKHVKIPVEKNIP